MLYSASQLEKYKNSSLTLEREEFPYEPKDQLLDPLFSIRLDIALIVYFFLIAPVGLIVENTLFDIFPMLNDINIQTTSLIFSIVYLGFGWLLAKYVFASDKLIDKISEYEEVVIYDYFQMKRYDNISFGISVGLFLIYIAVGVIIYKIF